jgi:CRP/FNR family transcriptional regulator, cyclic AMP receptor protein
VIQPLLDHLDEADRRQLLARMTRRAFRKGDTLFHEGDLGDTVHLLVKGRVAVRVTTPAGDVATLTVLGAGASFGEQALLSSDARRTASVVALEAVETRLLHRRDFDDLRARQGDADRFLVDVLAEQVRRLTGHVVEALYEPAETRVMRRLRDLVELYDEGADSVDVGVRQEDLASMAGTTRPTANRVLKQLAERAELQRRAG